MLLMAEMGLFVVLIVPFPFAVKRRIFTYVDALVPHSKICISLLHQ